MAGKRKWGKQQRQPPVEELLRQLDTAMRRLQGARARLINAGVAGNRVEWGRQLADVHFTAEEIAQLTQELLP